MIPHHTPQTQMAVTINSGAGEIFVLIHEPRVWFCIGSDYARQLAGMLNRVADEADKTLAHLSEQKTELTQ